VNREAYLHLMISLLPRFVIASQIADEVISHLNSLVGAKVRVTLEIDASIPDGAPEQVVRTVTENCKSLKFKQQGFAAD
jgi:hypothetical protein